MAIKLFMQATILLARYFGYQTLDYEEVREKSAKAGFSALPFMPPETIPATPPFKQRTLKAWIPKEQGDRADSAILSYQRWVENNIGYANLVKYYISTGLRASQIVCRNYLQGLDERNRYLEFLRAEFGAANGLADGVLMAVDANGTLRNAFAISRIFANDSLNAYEDYRFLKVDYEEARLVVETAQNVLAEYYYGKVDGRKSPSKTASGRIIYNTPFTFPDALNVIETQCTRAGIRRLLTKAVFATPANMKVDPVTGTIIFDSNTKAGTDASSTPVPVVGKGVSDNNKSVLRGVGTATLAAPAAQP